MGVGLALGVGAASGVGFIVGVGPGALACVGVARGAVTGVLAVADCGRVHVSIALAAGCDLFGVAPAGLLAGFPAFFCLVAAFVG